jgi:hypothetical protein
MWHETGEPPNGYEYKIEFGNGDISTFEPVNDNTDPKIGALLIWTYNVMVHRVLRDAVVAHEELLFLVKDMKICQEPELSVRYQSFFNFGPGSCHGHIQSNSKLTSSLMRCAMGENMQVANASISNSAQLAWTTMAV